MQRILLPWRESPVADLMLDRALAVYRQGLERFPEDHELLFGTAMILLRDLSTTPGYSEEEIAAYHG